MMSHFELLKIHGDYLIKGYSTQIDSCRQWVHSQSLYFASQKHIHGARGS